MSWLMLIPWIALVVLSLGYWSQVWKIYRHREVRDLSVVSYVFLACGFTIMAWQAHREGSTIFLVKQLMTLLPVTIILWQMWRYKESHWHDDDAPLCTSCQRELEDDWSFCPGCGLSSHVARVKKAMEETDQKQLPAGVPQAKDNALA